jgi:hypothetical protein
MASQITSHYALSKMRCFMRPNRSVVHWASAWSLLLTVETGFGLADPTGSFHFLEAPPGATEIVVPLAVQDSSTPQPQGYLVQRSAQPLEEILVLPPAIAGQYEEFFAYPIAELPDRTRYLVVLHEEKSLKFLNRHDQNVWWYARIYRLAGDDGSEAELLREGFQSQGNDVTFPIDLPLTGIGATKLKSLRTEIGFSISGNQNGRPQVFSGRGAPLQVTGSVLREEGKLTLTLAVPDALTVTPDMQATLRFQPLQPGLPEHTAAGSVTDFLTLGAARFIVTDVSADFSLATLAVVAGSLEQTVKRQLEVGTKMPPFSQVDLVTRTTITREHVLTRARDAAGVVFVFGDLPVPMSGYAPRMGPYGRVADASLPLRPAEVAEQATVEMEPRPLVVLVTRQIAMEFLYEDLRNETPDYLLLADFTDPLQTSFRLPQNHPGGWYGHPAQAGEEASLRQLFNLPADTLSIAAFDRSGSVVYVAAEAGGSAFLTSLAEARSALLESISQGW